VEVKQRKKKRTRRSHKGVLSAEAAAEAEAKAAGDAGPSGSSESEEGTPKTTGEVLSGADVGENEKEVLQKLAQAMESLNVIKN